MGWSVISRNPLWGPEGLWGRRQSFSAWSLWYKRGSEVLWSRISVTSNPRNAIISGFLTSRPSGSQAISSLPGTRSGWWGKEQPEGKWSAQDLLCGLGLSLSTLLFKSTENLLRPFRSSLVELPTDHSLRHKLCCCKSSSRWTFKHIIRMYYVPSNNWSNWKIQKQPIKDNEWMILFV